MRRNVFPLWWLFSVVLLIVMGLTSGVSFSESQHLTGLADLLSGSTIDSVGILYSLDEKDLPLALVASEILKFRALHGEIALSAKNVEDFRACVAKRLENAKTVSLKKTDACSIRVPEQTVELSGQKLIIPAHYMAQKSLIISDVEPKDEAGSLLPDIRVIFHSDQPISKCILSIDGKQLKPLMIAGETLLYRPAVNPSNVLGIGTHTAEVLLQDKTGNCASRSWAFTVGMKPVPSPSVPLNSTAVGSFSLPIGSLFPDSIITGTLMVGVFESSNGERFFEYSIFCSGQGTKAAMKTSNLFSLRKYLFKRGKGGFSGIRPK
ncbi:MAG: hypothetical protein HQM09_16570, partial [Candidatus Riflebacteria bacterium]|nr:hypothetical protein [Candidatus Riflebacteria bacterium]